jgi:hypothetical protein
MFPWTDRLTTFPPVLAASTVRWNETERESSAIRAAAPAWSVKHCHRLRSVGLQRRETEMKRFIAIALLGLGLGFAGAGEAWAAVPAPGMLAPNPGAGLITPARGGWWAVPAIVGGAILYDHLRRPRSCYGRCRYYHGPRYCRHACW